ncbi:hypothetical protein M0802_006996 [Mischocyttarus mexicanus]|nr:hypothetical protein M0802_006996 [Mischocyttarus mexicanus]
MFSPLCAFFQPCKIMLGSSTDVSLVQCGTACVFYAHDYQVRGHRKNPEAVSVVVILWISGQTPTPSISPKFSSFP